MKIKVSILFSLITILTSLHLVADDTKLIKVNNSFITKFEYGELLYNNPRGIGCNTCHGKDAKGKEIVSFTHIYDKKKYNCVLEVPNIKSSEYDAFFKKVNSKRNSKKKFAKDQICEKLIYKSNIMPTYFLVEEEIDAIYYYIKNLK